MSEELYNSHDYCLLAEQYEELQKENAELTADKIFLIQAAMDGGDKYHYTAHDIGYRDLERKVKALEADYVISNRELLILQAELARRDEIIKRLKEDAERLVGHAVWVGKFLGMKDCIFCGKRAKGKNEIEHTFLCPITLHRALMKELE